MLSSIYTSSSISTRSCPLNLALIPFSLAFSSRRAYAHAHRVYAFFPTTLFDCPSASLSCVFSLSFFRLSRHTCLPMVAPFLRLTFQISLITAYFNGSNRRQVGRSSEWFTFTLLCGLRFNRTLTFNVHPSMSWCPWSRNHPAFFSGI